MVDRYQKLYGIGPWEIRDGKKGFKDEAEDLMVYGKRQDFKVSLALCPVARISRRQGIRSMPLGSSQVMLESVLPGQPNPVRRD